MSQKTTSYRDAVRWGLFLAAVAVTGYRLPRVMRDFQQWRGALPMDPSAAELYRSNLEIDAIGMAVVLTIGVALFYALRPRNKNQLV